VCRFARGAGTLGQGLCQAVNSTLRELLESASDIDVGTDQSEPNDKHQCRFKVEGPVEGKAVVAAWADAYIRYDHRPAWQEQLRSEIKARSKLLDPSPSEILHAVFVGDKRVNADVENLVLYNIDSFTQAGRNGIRFEHSTVGPPASDDGKYPYHYNYSLVPSENTFTCWQPSREVASFGWTNVPIFSGEIKPAQVWLALARSSSLNLEAE
jgi:hypothetical protein